MQPLNFWMTLYLAGFDESSCYVEEAHVARNLGCSLANSQLEIEALSPTGHKEMNLAKNHAILKANPSSANLQRRTKLRFTPSL